MMLAPIMVVLIIVYLSITFLTGLLLYLLVKYIKEKPFGAQGQVLLKLFCSY